MRLRRGRRSGAIAAGAACVAGWIAVGCARPAGGARTDALPDPPAAAELAQAVPAAGTAPNALPGAAAQSGAPTEAPAPATDQAAGAATAAPTDPNAPAPPGEAPAAPASAAHEAAASAASGGAAASRCGAVVADSPWLRALLEQTPALAPLLDDPAARRFQVVVGVIDATGGAPCVTYHAYRLDAELLYAASAIKTFGALAALAEFDLARQTDPAYAQATLDSTVVTQPLSPPGVLNARGEAASIGAAARQPLRAIVEETLLVSSNEDYNRLFDIAGHARLHERAWAAGFRSVRLPNRLVRPADTEAMHRWSPPVAVVVGGRELPWLPERRSELELSAAAPPRPEVGRAHYDPASRERVEAPMPFDRRNYASLLDLLRFVAWVADPRLAPDVAIRVAGDPQVATADPPPRGVSARPDLPPVVLLPDSVALLRAIMARVPDEWSRFKPMSPGVVDVVPWERLRYVNKAGRAYGFHLDAAYIEDTSSGRAFLAAIGMHADDDGVINDDRYAYDSVSFPAMVALGRALAEALLIAPE